MFDFRPFHFFIFLLIYYNELQGFGTECRSPGATRCAPHGATHLADDWNGACITLATLDVIVDALRHYIAACRHCGERKTSNCRNQIRSVYEYYFSIYIYIYIYIYTYIYIASPDLPLFFFKTNKYFDVCCCFLLQINNMSVSVASSGCFVAVRSASF